MAEQETLTEGPRFDSLQHGLWKRMTEGDGTVVNHAAWLRACAEGGLVGSCRKCGSYLRPEPPIEVVKGRFDYSALCVVEWNTRGTGAERIVWGCGYEMVAPGGRIAGRSTRKSERGGQ